MQRLSGGSRVVGIRRAGRRTNGCPVLVVRMLAELRMLGACTLVRALRFVNPPWQCPRNAVQCMCDVLVSGLRVDSREGAGGVLSSGESASDGALLPLRGVSSYSNKRMDFLESIRSPGPLLPVPKVPKKGFDNVEKNPDGGVDEA